MHTTEQTGLFVCPKIKQKRPGKRKQQAENFNFPSFSQKKEDRGAMVPTAWATIKIRLIDLRDNPQDIYLG